MAPYDGTTDPFLVTPILATAGVMTADLRSL
jgi:hypothetical protein